MRRKATMRIAFAGSVLLAFAILLSGCGEKGQTVESAIPWSSDLPAALSKAKSGNDIVMVDFTAVWCPPCRAMEDSTFSDPSVVKKAASFIPVRVDVDKQRETAEKYGGNARKYGGIGIPNILFLDGEGNRIKQVVGYHGPQKFIAVMDSVLALDNPR